MSYSTLSQCREMSFIWEYIVSMQRDVFYLRVHCLSAGRCILSESTLSQCREMSFIWEYIVSMQRDVFYLRVHCLSAERCILSDSTLSQCREMSFIWENIVSVSLWCKVIHRVSGSNCTTNFLWKERQNGVTLQHTHTHTHTHANTHKHTQTHGKTEPSHWRPVGETLKTTAQHSCTLSETHTHYLRKHSHTHSHTHTHTHTGCCIPLYILRVTAKSFFVKSPERQKLADCRTDTFTVQPVLCLNNLWKENCDK
jgi:uncharacterized Fe-S cluster protein YjdI